MYRHIVGIDQATGTDMRVGIVVHHAVGHCTANRSAEPAFIRACPGDRRRPAGTGQHRVVQRGHVNPVDITHAISGRTAGNIRAIQIGRDVLADQIDTGTAGYADAEPGLCWRRRRIRSGTLLPTDPGGQLVQTGKSGERIRSAAACTVHLGLRRILQPGHEAGLLVFLNRRLLAVALGHRTGHCNGAGKALASGIHPQAVNTHPPVTAHTLAGHGSWRCAGGINAVVADIGTGIRGQVVHCHTQAHRDAVGHRQCAGHRPHEQVLQRVDFQRARSDVGIAADRCKRGAGYIQQRHRAVHADAGSLAGHQRQGDHVVTGGCIDRDPVRGSHLRIGRNPGDRRGVVNHVVEAATHGRAVLAGLQAADLQFTGRMDRLRIAESLHGHRIKPLGFPVRAGQVRVPAWRSTFAQRCGAAGQAGPFAHPRTAVVSDLVMVDHPTQGNRIGRRRSAAIAGEDFPGTAGQAFRCVERIDERLEAAEVRLGRLQLGQIMRQHDFRADADPPRIHHHPVADFSFRIVGEPGQRRPRRQRQGAALRILALRGNGSAGNDRYACGLDIGMHGHVARGRNLRTAADLRAGRVVAFQVGHRSAQPERRRRGAASALLFSVLVAQLTRKLVEALAHQAGNRVTGVAFTAALRCRVLVIVRGRGHIRFHCIATGKRSGLHRHIARGIHVRPQPGIGRDILQTDSRRDANRTFLVRMCLGRRGERRAVLGGDVQATYAQIRARLNGGIGLDVDRGNRQRRRNRGPLCGERGGGNIQDVVGLGLDLEGAAGIDRGPGLNPCLSNGIQVGPQRTHADMVLGLVLALEPGHGGLQGLAGDCQSRHVAGGHDLRAGANHHFCPRIGGKVSQRAAEIAARFTGKLHELVARNGDQVGVRIGPAGISDRDRTQLDVVSAQRTCHGDAAGGDGLAGLATGPVRSAQADIAAGMTTIGVGFDPCPRGHRDVASGHYDRSGVSR